ncbi:hypothetical protein J1614_004311 [Plenodomus biglobosus]|nr:hypothetical protein J1614_004311 [Plenodomus biglobosus]
MSSISPDAAALLSQIVFPLLDVRSENWSFFLGRVCPNFFHPIPLSNTANTIQIYRLVKSLKALGAWIDTEFRMWWDKVLNIDGW